MDDSYSQSSNEAMPVHNAYMGNPGWLMWLVIIIIIAIIIMFAYLASNRSIKVNREFTDEERELILRVEANYLEWIAVGSIFLASAIIIKGFERSSPYYSLIFFLIVVFILTIANVDYISERHILRDRGLDIFPRTDYLFIVITVVIIVCIFLAFEVLKNDILPGTMLEE